MKSLLTDKTYILSTKLTLLDSIKCVLKSFVVRLPIVKSLYQARQLKQQLHLSEYQLNLAINEIELLFSDKVKRNKLASISEPALEDKPANYLHTNPEKMSENSVEESHNVIVSLTSYGSRINTVHLTILSLMNQTVKPEKVILWLAKNEISYNTLPKTLLSLLELGLTIEFCDDVKSYKKLIPALNHYPNKTIITFDDDVIYPCDQVERLIECHKIYPNAIICHRAHQVRVNKEGQVQPYNNWLFDSKEPTQSRYLLPVGIGGVLYPVNSLHEEVYNIDAFQRLCPDADDLWFKAMALKNNTLTKLVNNPMPYQDYLHVPHSQETSLWQNNKYKNDQQLHAIFNAYPELSFSETLENGVKLT